MDCDIGPNYSISIQAIGLIDTSFELPIYALNSIDNDTTQVYNDIMMVSPE